MNKRITMILATLTSVLLAGSIAWAASPGPTIDLDSGTVISAGDAGEVVLSVGAELDVLDVRTAAGWTPEIEIPSGREVEVDFRSGDRRIQFNAELEDGEVRVRLRDRLGESETETASRLGSTSTTTSTTTSTMLGSTSAGVSQSTSGVESEVSAGDAGSVVLVVGSQLEIARLIPSPGWVAEIEVPSGREVEVDFRSGDRRIQFNAELEDGEVRVRLRDGSGESESRTTSSTDDSSVDHTTTTIDDSSVDHTTTTIDDSSVDDSTTTTEASSDVDTSGAETYSVPGVATVGVSWSAGRLTLASYVVMPGWHAEIQEQSPQRIRIDFDNGSLDARFEARLDDNEVRVEIRAD